MAAFLLFSTPALFAQSGIILSWDSEVGCLDYGYDKDREQPIETLSDDDCLQVCQGSIVNFNVDYSTQPVTQISWETDGGQITGLSNGDATAAIQWDDAYPNGNVSVAITLSDGQIISGSICVNVKANTSDYIENPYNYPITVNLSSDFGVFVPASLTIPANSYWFFTTDPIEFIPNQPLQGSVPVVYTVEGVIPGHPNEIVCEGYTQVDFMGLSGFNGGGMVQMTAVPNPVEHSTEVQYIVKDMPDYNGGIIKLYSLSGQLIGSQKVNQTQGRAHFDLSRLPAGTYVVVFFSHKQRLGQQILIKE